MFLGHVDGRRNAFRCGTLNVWPTKSGLIVRAADQVWMGLRELALAAFSHLAIRCGVDEETFLD